jgi:hypothetical protein
MELGAIPVMLRPASPDKNFLNGNSYRKDWCNGTLLLFPSHRVCTPLDAHWAGYPGPLLSSWAELEPFLASITPR